MNKKGIAQFILFAIFAGVVLFISFLGGFGTVFSIFKGLKSIPPVFYIVGGIFIIMWLLRGGKK